MKRLVCLLLLCSSAFAAPPKPGDKLGNDFAVMERGRVDTFPELDPRGGDTRVTLRNGTRTIELGHAVPITPKKVLDTTRSYVVIVVVGADGTATGVAKIDEDPKRPRVYVFDKGPTPSTATLRATTRDALARCPRSTQFGMDCIDYVATRWPVTLHADGTITLGKPVETHEVIATPQYHIDATLTR